MSTVTVANPRAIASVLQEGIAHHRSGRLAEAEAVYRRVLKAQPNHPEALHLIGLIAHQVKKYAVAEELIARAIAGRPDQATYFDHYGLALFEQGKHAAAIEAFRHGLTLNPNSAHLHHNLANALKDSDQNEEAVVEFRRAIALSPNFAAAYSNLGVSLKRLGRMDEAIAAYTRAGELNPNFPEVHNNLGNALKSQGRLDEAIAAYRRALAVKPEFPEAMNNLGAALQDQDLLEEAAVEFLRALKLKPDFPEAHFNLGNTHQKAKRHQDAVAAYRRAVELRPSFADAHYNLGNAYLDLQDWDAAIAAFGRCAEHNPDYAQAYYNLGNAQKEKGDIDAAMAAYRRALEIEPDYARAAWGAALTMPVLYDTEDEIPLHRERWKRGMARLLETLDLSTEEKRDEALQAVLSKTNFYFNYQGLNDREEQRRFGELVHRVTSTIYPQYNRPLAKRKIGPGDKIRVGFVSTHLFHHSVYKTRGGWIKYLDRDMFEVHTFYTGDKDDHALADIKDHSTHFHQYRDEDNEGLLRMVAEARLDALGFPDIGMDPKMQLFAGSRLAPVQFMGWAHPVSSGLPTMDYFVSNELMEPENAQEQYTEELVLLPRLGICYPYPPVPDPPAPKQRESTGRFVFLCSQSLFKLLPRHDDTYARIAKRVPDSEIWFIEHQRSKLITEQFRRRLAAAFEAHGVDPQGRIVIHQRMNFIEFLKLNQRADLLLDSMAWSGCNTTFEGMACGLPVVTMPGQVMRARHTCGILKAIGLDECIADSKDAYVDLAVRFAEDEQWRETITAKFRDNHKRAFMDRDIVRALGEWLQQVCGA